MLDVSLDKSTGNIHLSITSLVNELTNGLEVGITVSDIRFNNAKHLDGGLGEANKDAIVDLEKTEELKSLTLLWINLVDTLDTDHKGKLWLGWDVERAIRLGDSSEANLLAFCIAVLLDVLLGTLEDGFTLLLVHLV